MKIVVINEGVDFRDFSQQVIAKVEEGLDEVAQQTLADFSKTTDTWQDKPTFDIQKERLSRTVGTDDQIYSYVSNGTAVRYATMTADFQPKTKELYLGSFAGAGGKQFVSRKHPRPGIQARKFDEAVANKYQDGLAAEIIQAKINEIP